MSALPPITDIRQCGLDVRKVPEADIRLVASVAPKEKSEREPPVTIITGRSMVFCFGGRLGLSCRMRPFRYLATLVFQ